MTPPDGMSAYRDIFLSESAEYLQQITQGLIAIEADPGDRQQLESIFRGAHSLKGMAAAMGYDGTTEVTHRMESVLDAVRRGDLAIDQRLTDILLRAVDDVRDLIAAESEGGTLESRPILDELDALSSGEEAPEREARPAETPSTQPAARPTGPGEERALRVHVQLEETCVLRAVRAYMAIKRLSAIGEVVETVPPAWELEDEAFGRDFEVLVRTAADAEDARREVASILEVSSVSVTEERIAATAAKLREQAPMPKISEAQTVRVSIAHLDDLVDLVGELVILRSRLSDLAESIGRPELDAALGDLHQISRHLQEGVMQTRMVPVGNIFNRFPRMVRDLSHDVGKNVNFEMDGLDIELDRTVLDEIGDPIVHLLRNAIDHGLEPEPVRLAAGKPARGRIDLIAARDRDQVRIVVSDDGRGMDVERVWRKAVEKGLVDASERDRYSESDVIMLTATPGFSTVDQATRLSGRGVGLDVVKDRIEFLGGSLTVRSHAGKGTDFILSLPLTLAIIQSLLVESHGRVFALPLGPVTEVIDSEEARIETVDGTAVLIQRDGTLVPVTDLSAALDEGPAVDDGQGIVLLSVADETRALRVERLLGRKEIVVKPLSPLLADARGIGGATVLGDGTLALILDLRSLF